MWGEANDSVEAPIVSNDMAAEATEVARMYFLQQENASEHVWSAMSMKKFITGVHMKSLR
jgi:hypothetical protein